MIGLRRLSCLALALLAAASVSHAAVISSIYPSSGSLLGGQLLTITGSGFHREGTQGTTNAYVGNNLCKQIEVSTARTAVRDQSRQSSQRNRLMNV